MDSWLATRNDRGFSTSSNYRRGLLKIQNKKGYTMIEIMVVMGIIAVLAALGLGGLIAVRDMNIPDSASQDFLGNVRNAQNKAFLVMKDSASPTPHDTKAWTLKVVPNSTSYELYSYYPSGAVLISYGEKAGTSAISTNGATITIDKYDGSTWINGISDTIYLSFAAPFAKSYLLANTDCLSGSCHWSQSSRPSQDWQPNDTSIYNSTDNNGSVYYRFNFTFNNQVRSVTVKSNGDANVK